jgi:phospholipid-transporting ATPase
MLYHGRECYRKNAQLILFNFYKNILLVMPQLWFGFNNHFSSATIYDPWIYQLYNVAFTSFPIIAYAIFDQHHDKLTSLKEPHLYKVGLQN